MAEFKKNTLILDHRFDQKTKRHYLNGEVSVFHCHHYASLYSQLAIDAGETDLLADVAEDTFYDSLHSYFKEHGICTIDNRIDISCQFYAAVGLGKMIVNYLGDESGEVTLKSSHVDDGWMKKWNTFDKPVNYITVGYINGMFSAILDVPIKTFATQETQSIVKGDSVSVFKIHKI